MDLQSFVRQRRKTLGMTQPELAERAGVGLRFIRELEQGKTTLRMDKVNQVLRLFGHELAPAPVDREALIRAIEAAASSAQPEAGDAHR